MLWTKFPLIKISDADWNQMSIWSSKNGWTEKKLLPSGCCRCRYKKLSHTWCSYLAFLSFLWKGSPCWGPSQGSENHTSSHEHSFGLLHGTHYFCGTLILKAGRGVSWLPFPNHRWVRGCEVKCFAEVNSKSRDPWPPIATITHTIKQSLKFPLLFQQWPLDTAPLFRTCKEFVTFFQKRKQRVVFISPCQKKQNPQPSLV